MPFTFAATTAAADAPHVDAGMYDARFDGIETKFITGGQYGDGDRFQWNFTLLDDDGNELYDGEEPIQIDTLTSTSLNTTSKTQPRALRYLKALLSQPEYDAFVNGAKFDASNIVGRRVQVEVYIRDTGWPSISAILAPRTTRVSGRPKATPVTANNENTPF